MAKTLVTAAHSAGPHENSFDNCYARNSDHGMCPGVKTAEWLNALGDDDVVYATGPSGPITCGKVRDNWLKDSQHIVAVDRQMAILRATERRLAAELRMVMKQIEQIESTPGVTA